MKTITANGHTIEITHPEKVLFPKAGFTKMDVVNYYDRISAYLLPHLQDRPLTMHRFPAGIQGHDFYQKEAPEYFPDWIETIRVKLRQQGERTMINGCNRATLLYLANQGSITMHGWLSTAARPENPDRLIFDLDPPRSNFRLVQQAARELKQLFHRLDLSLFVMATGSSGMHLLLPLDGSADFEQSRAFAKKVAGMLAKKYPEKFTTEMRKNKRHGRLFVDYLRNAYGQTAVTPYALRALPEAPVATPLHWHEALRSDMHARRYHLRNIFRRLAATRDPMADFGAAPCNLSVAAKRLDGLKL
ncbi:MAG: non-homologous end-joining DNA ligase [Bacteroidales bacterium]|jgi:bifunctional non-homologous end joining protein LigD|nr:non-homologous end-joining DNA ligase [Bacteroidales bacterium]MDD3130806.1 non-homologous end-joining DNA ligase [Bacteroidales bacterium]NLO52757.1 ATP-dependent DNA ligase [Bacteroidales bacterium]